MLLKYQMKNPAAPFVAQEIAYFVPSKGWKSKVVKTQRALDNLLDRLPADAITQTRDVE